MGETVITHCEHLLQLCNHGVTHLHDLIVHRMPTRDMEIGFLLVQVLKELTKLRTLHCVERLISSGHPVCQECFEYSLFEVVLKPSQKRIHIMVRNIHTSHLSACL